MKFTRFSGFNPRPPSSESDHTAQTREWLQCTELGAVAEWVRALACTGDWTVRDGFESHCGQLRFGTLAIPFTPPCQCLSEETLNAVGPFYLVSVPGEVKDPTSPHWNV